MDSAQRKSPKWAGPALSPQKDYALYWGWQVSCLYYFQKYLVSTSMDQEPLSNGNATAKKDRLVFSYHWGGESRMQGKFNEVNRKVCLKRWHLSQTCKNMRENLSEKSGHSTCKGLRWEYSRCVWGTERPMWLEWSEWEISGEEMRL